MALGTDGRCGGPGMSLPGRSLAVAGRLARPRSLEYVATGPGIACPLGSAGVVSDRARASRRRPGTQGSRSFGSVVGPHFPKTAGHEAASLAGRLGCGRSAVLRAYRGRLLLLVPIL